MLGIRGESMQGKKTRRKVRFQGFSFEKKGKCLPLAEAINCSLAGGRLVCGVGSVPYRDAEGVPLLIDVGEEAQGLYPVAANSGGLNHSARLYLVGESGYVYEVDANTGAATKMVNVGIRTAYHAVMGADRKIYHLFAGRNRAYGGVDSFASLLAGPLQASCVCGGRFFVARTSGRLAYSAPFSPAQFDGGSDGGGTLYLPPDSGEIVGLAATQEAVYLFVERGIFRLQVAADAGKFALERLEYRGGRICPHSMIAEGEGAFFLSTDGAWSARGRRVERICKELAFSPSESECRVGRCDGTLLIDFDEGGTRRRLALTPEGDSGYFCDAYGELGGNEFFCLTQAAYRLARAGERTFQHTPEVVSKPTTLNTRYRKRLKAARLFGEGRVHLEVRSEGNTRTYAFELAQGEGAARLLDSGRAFVFRLRPDADAFVEGMEIEFDCTEDGNDD